MKFPPDTSREDSGDRRTSVAVYLALEHIQFSYTAIVNSILLSIYVRGDSMLHTYLKY